MHKQQSHHFVAQGSNAFGSGGSSVGPGSSHGKNNQYGNMPGSSGNEFLLESQKIIYAPPSREKSKQTVRSPMIFDGSKASNIGSNDLHISQGSEDRN